MNDLLVLNIKGSSNLTDSEASCISNLKSLKKLDISFCDKLTDNGVIFISKLNNLIALNLTSNPNITDLSLQYISNLSKLEELEIERCYGVTDNGISFLSSKLSNSLRLLNVSGCYEISSNGWAIGYLGGGLLLLLNLLDAKEDR
jgi:hypothetical protein